MYSTLSVLFELAKLICNASVFTVEQAGLTSKCFKVIDKAKNKSNVIIHLAITPLKAVRKIQVNRTKMAIGQSTNLE